jgi:hypothetical protein
LNKVNGKDDELTCNNTVEASFSAVKPADHRKVLLEEGTGTWCGWCPRGAVFLKAISPAYDYMILSLSTTVTQWLLKPMTMK